MILACLSTEGAVGRPDLLGDPGHLGSGKDWAVGGGGGRGGVEVVQVEDASGEGEDVIVCHVIFWGRR